MAFVNERISDEDYKKYALEDICKRFIVGGVTARDWTIDREREIYLRIVARGREETSHQSTWTLYWDGELIVLELEIISTSGPVGGARSGHDRLRRIQIPPRLEAQRAEIIADLKEAFTAYKDGGIYGSATSYTLTLDIDLDL